MRSRKVWLVLGGLGLLVVLAVVLHVLRGS